MKKMEKKNVILDLTLQFSLSVIEYSEELEVSRKYVLANQLLKSGTSIGANIREAQNAESKKDFIHKFKIASKEIEETHYWLELCELSKSYPSTKSLKKDLVVIHKIVNKILGTTIRGERK